MTDYFEADIAPDRKALNKIFAKMMWAINQEQDEELRKKMQAELRVFRALNLRWALLQFESDEKSR